MEQVSTIGIDSAKSSCQVHGAPAGSVDLPRFGPSRSPNVRQPEEE